MKVKEFHFELPRELIAQKPLVPRDASKLLVVDRKKKTFIDDVFSNILNYLSPQDCLVFNNTKVLPVRLYGRRKTGGQVEIFLLDINGSRLKALVKPSAKIKVDEVIMMEGGYQATVHEFADTGRYVTFNVPMEKVLEYGHMPLPPYIDRLDEEDDKKRYQTIYAEVDGATAAPTAGLHFTENIFSAFVEKGIKTVNLTLHTGYGTFAPIKSEDIADHKMHTESFFIGKESADEINKVKTGKGKVVAVGTTTARVLETVADSSGILREAEDETDIFIYPGYRFKCVDAMITNFHLPASTLIMLISALAGKELIFQAYKHAVEEKYRFFSYGDAMLIL